MGLDTTHDCWHGAYSAFSRWRNEVARAVGYMVEKVTWPDMGYPSDTVLIEWHRYEEKNYYGQWDELPHDPLLILIVHSDCEGDILPEHATLLADRLDEILPNIDDKDDGGHIGHRGGYRACDLSPVLGMQRLRTSQ